MRIDVISIFPDYLEPLRLSLPGKAQQAGLLDLRVHDLRDWTHDRHRTVDDTPYGGGAGMVMRPEPWGEALDAVTDDDTGTRAREPVLVVPSPAGEPFSQRVAEELATRPWLVFACGRYEGIDARVVEHARARMPVRELSVGDYVLNGGEAAALVITEAVVRLLPGFMGNPESLSEESHGAAGLLEYPLYTKPPVWRGLEVPAVLLSGDHGAIARWRHDQSLRRTTDRRPDLLHASRTLTVADLPDAEVRTATPADAAELLVLQRACWVQEAVANDSLAIPPLHDSLDDVLASIATWRTVVVRSHGRLVGSVRARLDGDTWEIGRIMVAADLQGRGLGRWLLEHVEALAPEQATRFFLLTGSGSVGNLRMYRKAGYRPVEHGRPGVVHLSKRRR
jgi:tRNA (guanine37-N1)-methyltransferase